MRHLRRAVLIVAASALAAMPTGAAANEPRLTVERSKLAAALTCHGEVSPSAGPPIIFVPGTGSDGSQVYLLGRGAFDVLGRPVCVVAFPDRTTADIQVSVQYLVHAIRRTSRKAHQRVAVMGVSQGGLLARVALTYWPSVRRSVADVVSAAGTHHGSTATASGVCNEQGCPAAIWQQAAGSNFLKALNNGRDETPGRTSWTTVRSANDELVQPQTGPAPTSALEGAENVLIQDVCPGRQTSHLATAVDSVTIAALGDALAHEGPAQVSRLPPDVCSHPYGTGLDEQQTTLFLNAGQRLFAQGLASVPRVRREPTVRSWAKGRDSRLGEGS
jgi:triacylglycerol esterase/lipase EstA (alpha/beta hydrolase family)